jgi:hypothetical protein
VERIGSGLVSLSLRGILGGERDGDPGREQEVKKGG